MPGSGFGKKRGLRRGIPCLAAIWLFAGSQTLGDPCTPEWAGGFTQQGLDDIVHALVIFDDGSGPALFAGGDFTTAGGVPASRIAKFNGTTWSPLGIGMDGRVSELAVFDDGSGPALYAGGDFLTAGGVSVNCIAKWDGAAWSALRDGTHQVAGTSGEVSALAVYDDGHGPALYVGGIFTSAGGIGAQRIAKWDGTNFSPLGGGVTGFPVAFVRSLTVFNDGTGPVLYAAGMFTGPGSNIAKWDGSVWSVPGTGTTSVVNALAVFNGALYAGGNFLSAGGESNARRIARWDGSTWSALGTGLCDEPVNALTVFDDGTGLALYAAGRFTEADGVEMRRIARWDGATWSGLGAGIRDDDSDPCWCSPSCNCPPREAIVYDLAPFDGALYVGGDFINAGCVPSKRIAKWACPPPNLVPPDFDRDGDVDEDDFGYFYECATGPGIGPPTVCCTVADLDADDDVDQADFGLFQRCLSGPGVPADPNCTP